MTRALGLFAIAAFGGALTSLSPVPAQDGPADYRVVYAQARHLEQELNEAGRVGYVCAALARVEPPGAGAPGVVVILGRSAGAPPGVVPHRVVIGGEADLQASLDRSGNEGYRLCGLTLDEEPPRPAVVAVMSRRVSAPARWQYGVEVLRNYKSSLARLAEAARMGALPVAAAPIDDNRVPDLRTWLVATERPVAGRAAGEIAVRSGSGPDALTKALNEQGKLGFQVALLWKDGNDVVAMMAKSPGGPAAFTYTAERRTPAELHFLSGLYLGDFPYLGGDRLVVADRSVSASSDLVEDPLPPLGPAGVPPIGATTILGDHISRNRGFGPASAVIRRGARGVPILSTVIVKRGQ
jgi:hypothetical protein